MRSYYSLIGIVVLLVGFPARAQLPPSGEVTYELSKTAFKSKLLNASDVTFCLYEQEIGGTALFCDVLSPSELVFEKVKSEKGGAAQALFGSRSFVRVRATIGSVGNPVVLGSGDGLWLELSTASDTLPRRQLTSLTGLRGPQGPKGDTGPAGPQGPVGPAGGVSGWEIVQGPNVSIGGAGQLAVATVQCSPGKQLLGGGGAVAMEAAPATVVLKNSYAGWPDTWVVYFQNVGGGGFGTVYAEAICADVTP